MVSLSLNTHICFSAHLICDCFLSVNFSFQIFLGFEFIFDFLLCFSFLYLMRFPSLYPLCTHFLSLSIFGVGNGNPAQYSCLENSMDRGAWQATICGVVRVRHDWVTFTFIFIIAFKICCLLILTSVLSVLIIPPPKYDKCHEFLQCLINF